MFGVGDAVRVRERTILGTRNKTPKGLKKGQTYVVSDVDYSLDGAYSWDDVYLEGFGNRKFCEFDLVHQNRV